MKNRTDACSTCARGTWRCHWRRIVLFLAKTVSPSVFAQVREGIELGSDNLVRPESSAQVPNNAFVAARQSRESLGCDDCSCHRKRRTHAKQFEDFTSAFRPNQRDNADSRNNNQMNKTTKSNKVRPQGSGSWRDSDGDGSIVTNNHAIEDAKRHHCYHIRRA